MRISRPVCAGAAGWLLTVALAHAAPSPTAPLGLWMSQMRLGNPAQGPLTITIRGAGSQATIGPRTAPVRVAHDSVTFAVKGEGRFLGKIARDRQAIDGFWIQAAVPYSPQPYATPTRLARTAEGRYSGTLVPEVPTYTLFYYVWEDSAGLRAAFRNPEFNVIGGANRWQLRIDGDSLHMTARADTTHPPIRQDAMWDRNASRIQVKFAGFDSLLTLSPCGPADSVRFWPRMPRGARQAYREPPDGRDGWTSARASSAGLDELALSALTQSLADTSPVARLAPLIHACLIERHGKLVYEEYFFGHDRDQTHDTRSAGKTFASVLVGTAMRQGARIAPESTITSLMRSRGRFANPDPRKERITLEHLMAHVSGLAADDNLDDSPGREDAMQEQTRERDWWKFMLDLPMAHEPGTHFGYSSGGMNLVGGGVSAATHRWLPELFDATVARPLQFRLYHFNLQPTEDAYLGGGIRVRPRDLLKLGRTYLDGGTWNGRRIVDSSWVARSTRQAFPAADDGLAWHRFTLKSPDGREYREYEANGNGGQMLIVVPELDLSVVFTAGNYMNGQIWWKWRDEIVARRIIPAIRDR
jgi:CubicO group peptidase (beta-lactamase class C family)